MQKSVTTTRSTLRWVVIAILGGLLFVFGALALIQLLASLIAGGRMLPSDSPAGFLGLTVGMLLMYFAAGLLLKLLGVGRRERRWLTIGWMLVYFFAWGFSSVVKGASLPILGGFALVLGFPMGMYVADLAAARGQGGRTGAKRQVARSHQQIVRASEFGRIPADTVTLLTQHVRHATGPIKAMVPRSAPLEVVRFTIGAVLQRTITDWWENGNTDGLTQTDIGDLQSFVVLAASLTAGDFSPQGQAIYRTTLNALLDDWLEHWNSDGVAGPPRR